MYSKKCLSEEKQRIKLGLIVNQNPQGVISDMCDTYKPNPIADCKQGKLLIWYQYVCSMLRFNIVLNFESQLPTV